MATAAAWRDDPAVVVFLIGSETRHPDEAAQAEWPRRGSFLGGEEAKEFLSDLHHSRTVTQLVVWFAPRRACEHDCTFVSLPLFL